MNNRRSYLLLQGVCSPFFAHLAAGLAAEGHEVHKIHFNLGDWLYWPGPAGHFRGRLAELPAFLADIHHRHGITDQILFGDCRPVHQIAIDTAQARNIRTHVYEEGYFRPNWVTLEREGVNGHSLLPRDPDWFRSAGRELTDPGNGQQVASTLAIRAIHDVVYNVAGWSNRLFYPHYRTHAAVNPNLEYLGYLSRLPFLPLREDRDRQTIHSLFAARTPFYFLPLQLSGDAQIRYHSRFQDMLDALEQIIASFALHAPERLKLVIKNHPLDPALVNYASLSAQLAARYGVGQRVVYLETGELQPILDHASGMVTINSSVGIQALARNCPTLTLADPLYNLPGLTSQRGLDEFWSHTDRPDPELFHCFRNCVIHYTQINGGFYSRQGIELAVANSLPRLTAASLPYPSDLQVNS